MLLIKKNLLATDFVLPKSRCKVKRKAGFLPRFHLFSAQKKNYRYELRVA